MRVCFHLKIFNTCTNMIFINIYNAHFGNKSYTILASYVKNDILNS